MDIFFKRLVNQRNTLSDLEQQVLDYFMKQPEKVETHTLEELSKDMFVSTATISRTFKKLGYSGFQDFKFALNDYQKKKPVASPITENQTADEHIKRFELEMENNLNYLRNIPLKKITKLIKSSRHLEFFGVGNSLPIAQEAARKFTFAGRLATSRIDWDELRVVAETLKPDDLAVIISLSGETLHVLEYANILYNNQVPILAMVGTESSHLEELATITIRTSLDSYYVNDIDMSSRFPFNLLLDLLILDYLNEREYKK